MLLQTISVIGPVPPFGPHRTCSWPEAYLTWEKSWHLRASWVNSWSYLLNHHTALTMEQLPVGLPGPQRHPWRKWVTFHLQLHDQVVVSGALIDVLQGHDVLMLDPGEREGSWWVVCGLGVQTRNGHPAHWYFLFLLETLMPIFRKSGSLWSLPNI